jgi:hypothetical protein
MKVDQLIKGRIYQSKGNKQCVIKFEGGNRGVGFGVLGRPAYSFMMNYTEDWEDITDSFNELFMGEGEEEEEEEEILDTEEYTGEPLSEPHFMTSGVWGTTVSVNHTFSGLDSLQFRQEGSAVASDSLQASSDMRQFDTGANRNSDEGKLDFEGFLSASVLEAYAIYMNSNRTLENGDVRASDNWQKGIPKDAYMKSMFRHFFDVWKDHRDLETNEDEITNLCGLLFNVSGMLHEKLKDK